MRLSAILRNNARAQLDPQLVAELSALLQLSPADVSPLGQAAGAQSTVWSFATPCGPVAVKRFWGEEGERSATAEYRALNRAVSCAHPKLRMPNPLGVLADVPGYVMEWVNFNQPADGSVRLAANRDGLRLIADETISSLRAFHQCVDQPFEDFQPGNVFLSNGQVWLIDPTHLGLKHKRSEGLLAVDNWVAHDLSYWVFSVATSSVKLALIHPVRCYRRLLFTRHLLVSAAAEEQPSRVGEAAVAMVKGWVAGRNPRSYVIRLGAILVASSLCKV
jgi:hypothetical protein